MFRLIINANLIAKGVTAEQAYDLVGEILRRTGSPERAETVMFDANGGESVRAPRAEAERREEAELGIKRALDVERRWYARRRDFDQRDVVAGKIRYLHEKVAQTLAKVTP